MITLPILAYLSIAPGIAICLFIYFRDKYEKEPKHLLVKSFFLGFAAIVMPIAVETLGSKLGFEDKNNMLKIAVYAFIFVGFSEELSKFIFLRIFAYRNKAFNEPFDGIVYSVMVSMGFATLENIFYVFPGGIPVGILRLFMAIPGHACFAIIMGYFVGRAKFSKNSFALMTVGVVLASVAHGFYDYFLMQDNYDALKLLTLVVLILCIVLSFIAIKSNQKASPFKTPTNQQ